MPIADLKYIAGTIKTPQHTKTTEAAFIDTDKVHFPDGKLTVIPAYIEALGVNISGICRSIYATIMNNAFTSAGHFFFGTHSHLYSLSRSVTTNITPLKTTASATLGSNPLATVNLTPTITVTYTAHGLAVGDRIRLSGATATGGILAADINKEHIVVTTPTADTFTITAASNATSTTSGGGAAVEIFKQINAGNEYQEFLSGFGVGDYSEGNYGESQTSTLNFTFPRIWSFDNFGREVIMCAGDYDAGDGQKIYLWNGDIEEAPQILANAPTNCNWVFTLNNRVVALCENIIRISKRGDAEEWTNGADALTIQKTGRIISGVSFGDKASLVFAPDPYLLTDNGDVVDLVELGVQYAIIAPQAFCKFNDGVLWYGADHKLYFYNGTTVQEIINRQNGEFIRDTISLVDYWTCFMHSDPKHKQAWFYFPDKDNKSPNRYVIFNPTIFASEQKGEPSFALGMLDRTAAQRSTFVENSFYLTSETDVYASFVNEAISFNWNATTAAVYVDGTYRYKINYVVSDLVQSSNITVKVLGVAEPQKTAIDYGNFTLSAGSGKVGVRGAGKLFQFQFSGNGDMLLGGMKMYLEQQGEKG